MFIYDLIGFGSFMDVTDVTRVLVNALNNTSLFLTVIFYSYDSEGVDWLFKFLLVAVSQPYMIVDVGFIRMKGFVLKG